MSRARIEWVVGPGWTRSRGGSLRSRRRARRSPSPCRRVAAWYSETVVRSPRARRAGRRSPALRSDAPPRRAGRTDRERRWPTRAYTPSWRSIHASAVYGPARRFHLEERGRALLPGCGPTDAPGRCGDLHAAAGTSRLRPRPLLSLTVKSVITTASADLPVGTSERMLPADKRKVALLAGVARLVTPHVARGQVRLRLALQRASHARWTGLCAPAQRICASCGSSSIQRSCCRRRRR